MTVYINGRTAVHQNSGGILRTTDVCYNDADEHVPYTNIAKAEDAAQTARTVFINGYPICHQRSIFKKSRGDESGKSGVRSGCLKGKAEFITGSADVFIESHSAVRHGDLMISNNRNTAPMPLLQPGAIIPPHIQVHIDQYKSSQLTDYQINIDIVGQGAEKLSTVLQADYGDDHKIIPLNRNGDLDFSNQITRRLALINVAEQTYTLSLAITNTLGKDIIIPLAASGVQQCEQNIAAGHAPNILVPVNIAWAIYPNDSTLTKIPGDLTDISRFPDILRKLIYQQVDQHSAQEITNKPWTDLISDSVRELIQQQLQPEQEQRVQPGWLYVFKDGKLWRELQIINGQLHDVDLSKQAGLQQREATGVAAAQLILPYKINNVMPKIEIAYSSVQWRWQRVNFFGGLAADDKRLSALKRPILMPTVEQQSKAGENRQQRFVTLDLSRFVAADVQLEKTQAGPERMPYLKSIRADYLPTLLIYDPIGVVTRVLLDLSNAWHELQNLMNQTRCDEYFKSALLAYRVFFDEQAAHSDPNSVTVIRGTPSSLAMASEITDTSNSEKPASHYLDQEKIATILRVKERAAIRQRIRYLQSMLLEIIDDKAWCNQVISFTDALRDYFSASSAPYLQALQVITGIISNTSVDPQTIDSDLDINVAPIKTPPPGINYLTKIFSQEFPLYFCLFPSDAQYHETVQQSPKISMPTSNMAEGAHDNGSGEFNVELFSEFVEQSVDLFNGIMTTWFSNITRYALTENIDESNRMAQLSLWLLKASGQESFQSLTLLSQHELTPNVDIIGFEHKSIIDYLTQRGYNRVQKNITHDPDAIPLYQVDAKTGRRLSENPIHEFTQADYTLNHGAFATTISADDLYTLYRSEQIFRTPQVKLFAQPKEAPNKSAKNIFDSTKSVLLALQLFNLNTVLQSLNDSEISATTTVAQFIAAIGAVVDQLFTVLSRFIDQQKIKPAFKGEMNSPSITKFFSEKLGLKLTWISALSMLENIATVWLTINDIMKSYREYEQGKLAGGAITLSSFILTTFSSMLENFVHKQIEETIADEVPTEVAEATITLSFSASILLIIGAIAIFVDRYLEIILVDPQLIHWAKNSPFSKDYQNTETDHHSAELLWNLLIQPRVMVKDNGAQQLISAQFYVEVTMPYFQVNDSCLDIRSVWQEQEYLAPTLSPQPGIGYLQYGLQHSVKPYRIDQLMEVKSARIVAMRYYYNVPNLLAGSSNNDINTSKSGLRFYSKMRVYFDKMNYQIPAYNETEKTNAKNNLLAAYQENLIKSSDKTWLYAMLEKNYRSSELIF